MYNYTGCADAGTEYCPCSLAEAGRCPVCQMINGSQTCDCVNWQGVCIYSEYMWNELKAKDIRKYTSYKVKDIVNIRKDIKIFEIDVGKVLSERLLAPGSFVFLKKHDDDDCFGVPLSILDCDVSEGSIKIIIRIKGIKTKKIEKAAGSVDIKGPYHNGIFGIKNISSKTGETLILGRGTGAAPGVLCARFNNSHNIYTAAVLDRGRGKESYIKPHLAPYCSEIYDIAFYDKGEETKNLSPDAVNLISNIIETKGIKKIVAAGSDRFIIDILKTFSKKYKDLKFVSANNSIMCCGEGICGSCSEDKRGVNIRKCKCQYNPLSILEGAD